MSEIKINHFARHRTRLSNERTLLSYIRTAVALFAAGVTFIRFFGVYILIVIGFIFIFLSLIITIMGFVSFFRENQHINDVR